MRFLALGGGHEVGASCNFIELNNIRLLVDAGIRVNSRVTGAGADALPDLARLTELGGIDAVIVTHAHLDHIGALPLVHQAFPDVPIYATTPTVHLAQVLLADAIKLMAQKAEREMECPLYDAGLVGRMFTRVIPLPLGSSINIAGTVKAHFFPAGHILGAAMIGLESDEGRILVSGDISAGNQRTIPGLVIPRFKPHLLVLESTYGNRLHANRQQEEKGLAEAVEEIISAGGHVLVPAFALGRSQEVILLLQAYQQANRICKFPVWVDGMVRSICQTYSNFPEYLQGPLKRMINNGTNPFYRERSTVQPVTASAQREKVLAGAPGCIVASSGMLSGGPSQFYAARLAGDVKNAILLCGYQDEESPGHKLLSLTGKSAGELTINGISLQVRCRVDKYGLSAHADGGELSTLVNQLKPRRVILVHGEQEARRALAERLAGQYAVHQPDNGEELRFAFRHGRSVPATEAKSPRAAASTIRESSAHRLESTNDNQENRPINLAELWSCLIRDKTKISHLFTAEELATLWYGPAVSPDQKELTSQLLEEDKRYFASDWKHPYFYRPRKPGLVAVETKREQLAEQLQHLPGHLVLVKDSNGAVRPGICFAVDSQNLAVWKVGQEGTLHPAESLLEIIAPWPFASGEPSPQQEKPRLYRLLSLVKPVFRNLKPLQLREQLNAAGKEPLPVGKIAGLLPRQAISNKQLPENDISPSLPGEMINHLALAWRLNAHPEYFERTEAGPGYGMYKARPQEPGEAEQTMDHNDELTDRIEQNAALLLADKLLPPNSGLYRKGVNREEGKITLYFHFPQTAKQEYHQELEQLAAESGWEIETHPEAHHGALAELARKMLSGWRLSKPPSIYRELRQVVVHPEQHENLKQGDFAELVAEFEKTTGYQLLPAGTGKSREAKNTCRKLTFAPDLPGAKRMEINQSYDLIRSRLQEAGATIYRTGKKATQDHEYIEASFISPQTGEKYTNVLEELAKETGWELRINPEPNQNEIKLVVRSQMPSAWGLKKEPAFIKDRQEVRVKLAFPPSEDDPLWEKLVNEIRKLTGYTLTCETTSSIRPERGL